MRMNTLALLALLPVSALAVSLQQTPNTVTVKNKYFTASFDKKTGYAVKIQNVGNTKTPAVQGYPMLFLDNELEKYENRYCPLPSQLNRAGLNLSMKVLENSEEMVKLEISYPFQGGKSTELVTITETPAIRYDITVDHTVRLFAGKFRLYAINCGDDGTFLQEGKPVSGVWTDNGGMREGAGWEAAWFPGKKVGVGLAVISGSKLRGVEYSMQTTKEGWGSNGAYFTGVCGPLSDFGNSGKAEFHYAVLAASDPAELKTEAEKLTVPAPEYQLFSFETEKLTLRPGEKESVFADVRNNSKQAAELTLKLHLTYGLDQVKELPDQKVKLAAGEWKTVQIPVALPEDLKKGAAICCELLDPAGKSSAKAMDFFTVTTFAPRDAGFGIINVGQAHQWGAQDAWNRNFKRKYTGAYEYYCWTLSTIGGLAPEVEEWYPCTENVYYHKMSKDFLKKLVSNAHSHGIGVYAWISGLWNYEYGLQHPEMLQYSKTGEPNIYSGTVLPDGTRSAVLKPHMFEVKRAEMWAKEMADSVDMFGWDGCRWDWHFLPSAMSDPLYMGDHAEDWYDWKGTPQSKLFPNPDKTAYDCLAAWRKVLEKRHPNFVYGCNFGSAKQKWDLYPLYHQESARDALVLFEDMLNYSRKEFCTFEKWGNELTLRCDLARKCGGAPVVGSMSGLARGNTSYDLAHYTAASSGVKWWDNHLNDLLNEDPVRNRYFLRFAEYYFSCDFLHPEKTEIQLKDETKVLWKPFLRERMKNGVKETVIPLVNLPDDTDYICQFHKTPTVRKNLVFQVPGNVESVYWMTPQAPEKAVKLTVENGTFTVPELHNAGMILIRRKGN